MPGMWRPSGTTRVEPFNLSPRSRPYSQYGQRDWLDGEEKQNSLEKQGWVPMSPPASPAASPNPSPAMSATTPPAFVEESNLYPAEESDEECAWAPGSPTGRQGSDLMAAKAARQSASRLGEPSPTATVFREEKPQAAETHHRAPQPETRAPGWHRRAATASAAFPTNQAQLVCAGVPISERSPECFTRANPYETRTRISHGANPYDSRHSMNYAHMNPYEYSVRAPSIQTRVQGSCVVGGYNEASERLAASHYRNMCSGTSLANSYARGRWAPGVKPMFAPQHTPGPRSAMRMY